MTQRSDTINAVFQLLRSAAAELYGPSPATHTPAKPSEPGTFCPNELVAFASAHFVLPAVAGSLISHAQSSRVPDDFIGFLACTRLANANRNRGLLESLNEITKQLNSVGITPVALKGAAFLLDDVQTPESTSAPAPWRFMNDIDLLVPKHRLMDCVDQITALGFVPVETDYEPETQAHYPPLISPCGTFSIELHTRLFAHEDFDLPAEKIFDDARTISAHDIPILVPSPEHRLAHVLVHSQLHNRNYFIDRIVLKDFLDISVLCNRTGAPANLAAVTVLFSNPSHSRAICALVAAWQLSMNPDEACNASKDPKTWGKRAISKLYRPAWRKRLDIPGDVARMEINRLCYEQGHLRRRIALISNPARLKSATEAYSGKMRQRLWS